MKDSENLPQKAITWVPQVFYDMIARIVPGIVVLLVTFAILLADKKTTEIAEKLSPFSVSWAGTTIIILVFISLAYTVGVLLAGLVYSLFATICKILGQANFDFETCICDEDEVICKKYDFIKRKHPQAGERITKLKAEIHMSYILSVGFFILGVVAWMMKSPFNWFSFLKWALVIGLLGGVGATLRFRRRLKSEVNNYAKMLGYEEPALEIKYSKLER